MAGGQSDPAAPARQPGLTLAPSKRRRRRPPAFDVSILQVEQRADDPERRRGPPGVRFGGHSWPITQSRR